VTDSPASASADTASGADHADYRLGCLMDALAMIILVLDHLP
jgi:hypothetical protein